MFVHIIQFIILLKLIWMESVYGNIITVRLNGNDSEDCMTGQIPCALLDYALNHSQSGDYVNIMSSMISLLTVVALHNVNNITIRGQGNTTVMCNNTGGVACNNCSDVLIEGIIWDQCGNPDLQNREYPNAFGGLNFTNITNLFINHCTLQHSRVRALSLYLVAGSINISNTQFLSNANNDDIYCFQGTEYIRCVTDNRTITGAVYVQDFTNNAQVIVFNCNFSNNGHFGEVRDEDPTSICYERSEIADGAAIRVLHTTSVVHINITVENCVFMNNRGRSGGAVNINVSKSLGIEFNNVNFWNNSVVQNYINSSALFVYLTNTSSTLIQLSNCDFQYNNGGRNVIGFIVAGEPSNVHISNCKLMANKHYNVGLVELTMQSQSNVAFSNSTLTKNSGSALLYVQLRSANVTVSLHDIHVVNNCGSSALKSGGLMVFRVLNNNCKINFTRFEYSMNSFSHSGGGLYITGILKENFKCYVQDSYFKSNVNIGQGLGSIIFSSLQSDNAYVFAIYNCSFVNNTGGSIVYIGKIPLMEDLVFENKPLYLFMGQSTSFTNNTGTAVRLLNVILVGNGYTEFSYNTAQSGAGLHLMDSYVLPYTSSFQFSFFRNFAIVRGGAVFIDFTTQCPWLLHWLVNYISPSSSNDIRIDCPQVDVQLLHSEFTQQPDANFCQMCCFNYTNNSASVAGSTIFYSVPSSTPIENLSNPNSTFYIPDPDHCMSYSYSSRNLATQPRTLILNTSAASLYDGYSSYFLDGIMLGQEISIDAKIIGYNNESAEATTFFIDCVENCSGIEVMGRRPILIDDQLSGVSISGQESASTMSIKLQLSSNTITVNLTVELTSCLPGYVYDISTMQCECFTTDDIISCSPNTTIKRDYWFGVVDDITTVSVCPNGYCNFSHREDEVASGRSLLSTIQDDQCNEHRTGPACGECDPGYTLSYDSVDCVSIDDCHYKYIIAVIVWTLAYWILVIVFLFAVMWLIINCLEYGNGIGYLYGIIYYYSVADILLGQIVSFSDGLNILVSVLSIFFKLNPGLDLFTFCFIKDMQRTDQYFINYIHSTAILLFILLLVLFARRKRLGRLTLLIGKIIIPIICLILTIAYTSIADTSLEIFRYVTFIGVDGTYIYLSPSIEYFTGRHIVYFLVALLYEFVIVCGLPFLLILSHWWPIQVKWKCIHIDLKPILDHFQGCYKDNYRWFAAVYLICRQVILVIVVIDFSDYYIELYLLTIVCLITAILHYTAQPYVNDVLNKCDGVLLQLLLLVVSLQMIAFSNDFTVDAVEGIAYVLLLLPIVLLILLLLAYILKPWLVMRTAVNLNVLNSQHAAALLGDQPSNNSGTTQERAINYSISDCADFQETLFNYMQADDK